MTAQIKTGWQVETRPTQNTIAILGGVAAGLIVLTALAEMAITFLPGGYASAETVVDWFALLQANPFLGLRNLGLLNIFLTAFGVPLTISLYALHRRSSPGLAALALALAMVGTAVFYATNRAFPMLDLSRQYAAAGSLAEKAALEAAGLAMLSVGQSHTPGTFLAFFFSEVAGILMGVAVWRGTLFRRLTGLAGVVGYSFLLAFEILVSFTAAPQAVTLSLAMIGGLSNLAWYALAAARLLQLGRDRPA